MFAKPISRVEVKTKHSFLMLSKTKKTILTIECDFAFPIIYIMAGLSVSVNLLELFTLSGSSQHFVELCSL